MVTSLIIFWSFGTDENYLNNCGENLRYFLALCDFEKNFCLGNVYPVHFHECFRLEINFHKMVFCCFHLGKKWFSRLKRIPSGIFRHFKIDKISTIVFFANLKNLVFRDADFKKRDADLGRSRLVFC